METSLIFVAEISVHINEGLIAAVSRGWQNDDEIKCNACFPYSSAMALQSRTAGHQGLT